MIQSRLFGKMKLGVVHGSRGATLVVVVSILNFLLFAFRDAGPSSNWLRIPPTDDMAAAGGRTFKAVRRQPIIHACARFSLRYELHHILPWLLYHERVGVAHFNLYFDGLSSDLNIQDQKDVYDKVAKLPFVTVYDMLKLGIYEEWRSTNHCLHITNYASDADWVIDYDVDEVFAFGQVIAQKPESCDQSNGVVEDALVKWAAQLPLTVLAVVIPRLDFGQNGHTIQPLDVLNTQMDLYTQRAPYISGAAKILIRTTALQAGAAELFGKHDVKTCSQNSVVYPNGLHAQHCSVETNGMYLYFMNTTQYSDLVHTVAPRLHHYVSRSFAECNQKVEDSANASWYKESGFFPWRTKSTNMCDPTRNNQTSDFSLYCSGQVVARDLKHFF